MKVIRAIPLIALFALSLAVSFFACYQTRVMHFEFELSNHAHLVWKVFFPAAIWVALLVVSLVAHGWRALWLLIGAPFALLWPYEFTKLYIECKLTPVHLLPSWCPGG